MKIAINKVYGNKNSILNTVEPKYSSSLKEKPNGSLSLIKPEKINRKPTSNLDILTMIFSKVILEFIIIYLNELKQKLHN